MTNLEKLGNFENYIHDPKSISAEGLIETPELILKRYEMSSTLHREFLPVFASTVFIGKEIANKNIKPLSGLGFAILSKDMLNVARWDSQYPTVLKNQIYVFDPKEEDFFKSAKIISLDEIGPFCIWELGIVAYERDLWKRYLSSDRKEKDKINYLASQISGDL